MERSIQVSLDLNFSGIQDGFPKVAEGEHILVIDSAEVKASAKGDSQNLILKCTVTDSDLSDEIGKNHLEYVNIQASTMWRVKQFFIAITGNPDVEGVNMEPEDLVGSSFKASFEHDEKYANITAFAPVG
jgi:hypothetical protein